MTAKHAITLGDIVKHAGVECAGDLSMIITGVNGLADATATEVAFLDNMHYRNQLATTKAAAVFLKSALATECPTLALPTSNPYLAFAKACELFVTPAKIKKGKHRSAVVGKRCKIAKSAAIGANAVIGDGVTLGERVMIGAGTVVGNDCVIGDDTVLMANVTLYDRAQLGKQCLIHSGAVIGSDGFGNANDNGVWYKIPQMGCVIIGDDVEIGANTTVDCGTIQDTVIGDNVRIDNLVQIAHNVTIGAHTAIAGCAGVAGSAKIGEYCMIGGAACINGHIEVCSGAIVAGMAMVTASLTEPGIYGSGTGVMPMQKWKRSAIHFQQLDELVKRIRALEEKTGK